MQITDEMVDKALHAFDYGAPDPDRPHGNSPWDAMRRALEAAAAPTLSPPPAGATVPVRVAVAFDNAGAPYVMVTGDQGDDSAWRALVSIGHLHRSCIATIPAPVPAVPEVGVQVQPAGEG